MIKVKFEQSDFDTQDTMIGKFGFSMAFGALWNMVRLTKLAQDFKF